MMISTTKVLSNSHRPTLQTIVKNMTSMRSTCRRKKRYQVTRQTPSRNYCRHNVDVLKCIDEDIEQTFSYRGVLLQLSNSMLFYETNEKKTTQPKNIIQSRTTKATTTKAKTTTATTATTTTETTRANSFNKRVRINWRRLLKMSQKRKRRESVSQ